MFLGSDACTLCRLERSSLILKKTAGVFGGSRIIIREG